MQCNCKVTSVEMETFQPLVRDLVMDPSGSMARRGDYTFTASVWANVG